MLAYDTLFESPKYCQDLSTAFLGKWAPSCTAKTAASVNIRLQDTKTAAKSHRTPGQQYFCRRVSFRFVLFRTRVLYQILKFHRDSI